VQKAELVVLGRPRGVDAAQAVILLHPLHVLGHDELRPALAVLRLLPRPAEAVNELAVDERDRRVLLEDHRRGARRLEEGPVPGLRFPQLFLRALLLGDVHGVAEDGRPAVQRDGGHRLEDPAGQALLRDDAELVRRGTIPAEHGAGVPLHGLAVLGVHHEVRFPADELLGGVAGVGGGVGVDEAEPAVLDDVDAGDGLLREGPEEVLALPKRLGDPALGALALGDHGGGAKADRGGCRPRHGTSPRRVSRVLLHQSAVTVKPQQVCENGAFHRQAEWGKMPPCPASPQGRGRKG